MMDQNLCVIFGNPVAHSKSPEMQMQFAKNSGIDLTYLRVLAPLDQFEATVKEWQEKGIYGANITVPFKEMILPLCARLTPEAKIAGAVNTIRVENDGSISGHNTDGIGLIRDITVTQNIALAGKRVLVLGAGGAVRGILKPLLDENPDLVVLSNRTQAKAEQLAAQFKDFGNIEATAWQDLSGEFDLIINGTSASLQQSFPDLPCGVISAETIGYDLVYSNEPTVFMQYIVQNGGKAAHDGLGMLIEQGVYAFEFWFGVKPSIDGVLSIFGRD